MESPCSEYLWSLYWWYNNLYTRTGINIFRAASFSIQIEYHTPVIHLYLHTYRKNGVATACRRLSSHIGRDRADCTVDRCYYRSGAIAQIMTANIYICLLQSLRHCIAKSLLPLTPTRSSDACMHTNQLACMHACRPFTFRVSAWSSNLY